MPISDEDIVKALESQDHKEWKKYKGEWKFIRAALNRELIGDKSEAIDTAIEQRTLRMETNPDARNALRKEHQAGESYLVRQPVESDLSYAIRLIFGFDGNESYQTLRTLLGFLLKDYSVVWDGLPKDYTDRIQNNIDGEGTDFKQFVEEAAEEIAGLGKCYGWIYTCEDEAVPIHEFVEREKVRDWYKDDTDFMYVKFEDCREDFSGVLRTETHTTVILTPEQWFFCTKSDGKWNIVRQDMQPDNDGFFIPFVDGWCGKYAKSVIATAAYLQFLLMNADSVAFQIIRNQMLAVITGPTGTKDQLTELTTNTVVDIPADSSRGLEIVGYPKTTIDGHFQYLENQSAKVSKSANLRENTALAASGESKDWDFMPTAALLDRLADHVENYVNGVFKMFERFAGVKSDKKRFSIKREFDKKGLKETLEVIFSGLSMQLGDTADVKLKMKAMESFKQIGIDPTKDEWAKIESEISATGRSATLEKLMEVSINGQNQKTIGSPAQIGSGQANGGVAPAN